MSAAITDTSLLAYDERGTGQAVALVHGLTFRRETWQPVVDALPDRFRCVAVDLPAHGETPGPPVPLDGAADALHRTLAALDAARPVVVGHSIGAMIALSYAARYPCAGLVTVDQPLYARPFGELLARLAPALRGPGFAETFEMFQRSMGIDTLPEPARSATYAAQTIRQDVVVGYWAELLDGGIDVVQRRIDETTSGLAVPYLAVFGQQLPDDQRDYLRRQVPTAQVEEWPGASHLPHLADPARFATRLAAFVDSCAAAR